MQNNTLMGVVYNIQRYSMHDGPGIRQTVFFKGCPLKCWWCLNPESQNVKVESLQRQHQLDGNVFTQEEKIGRKITVDELINEINKDLIFYDESEGGVTFSGGEPSFQPEFLSLILDKCKETGIHTTIDSCGFTSKEILENVLSKANLILYDLKHMDNELHKKYTGVPNTQILENLRWLDSNKKNVIIRFPVIPRVNDTEENINLMLDFLSNLKHIRKISLLPYHTIASHKYQKLNMPNKMEGVKALEEKDLYDLKDRFETIGFDARIGN